MNFGIVYGIGDYSLAQDLGISRREAGEYIAGYLASYPGVAGYLEKTVADAKRDGYTSTVFGRRRYIPELSSRNKNLVAFGERVAKNSPIQGSAADIIKIAMIDVHRRLEEEGLDAVSSFRYTTSLLWKPPKRIVSARQSFCAPLWRTHTAVKCFFVPMSPSAEHGSTQKTDGT